MGIVWGTNGKSQRETSSNLESELNLLESEPNLLESKSNLKFLLKFVEFQTSTLKFASLFLLLPTATTKLAH
jgi:hypothetical protein